MINKNNLSIMCLCIITFFCIHQSNAFDIKADIHAPSENNIYTVTVQNSDTISIENVNIQTLLNRNPDNLVTIQQITPQDVSIPAGQSQIFQISFDVDCPPQGIVKTEKVSFSYSVTSTTDGQYTIKECQSGPLCHEYIVELFLEESFGKCNECINKEEVKNDCDDDNKCTLDTCQSYNGCLHNKVPFCYSYDIDNSDPTYIQYERGNSVVPENDSEFQFSPLSSINVQDHLELNYSVPYLSLVNVLIFNNDGSLLKILTASKIKNAGAATDIWDGKDTNNELLPDGRYRYSIIGVNLNNLLKTWRLSGDIIIDNDDPGAQISYIRSHYPESKSFSIFGSATDPNLKEYQLECFNDNTHVYITESNETIVDGQLGVLNASYLEDATYTLRLTVYDHAGNSTQYEQPFVFDSSGQINQILMTSITKTMNTPDDKNTLSLYDDPDIWIDDELPIGSTEIHSWEWDNNQPFSGDIAHTNSEIDGIQKHYFIHSDKVLQLPYPSNLIQYVYLDPNNIPDAFIVYLYASTGEWKKGYYFEKEYSYLFNNYPQFSNIYRMGLIPPAGEWLRLKIPYYYFRSTDIKGMAFITINGKAYWDKTTTSGYNDIQKSRYEIVEKVTEDNSSDIEISFYISKPSNIVINIYDAEDNLITQLHDSFLTSGSHKISWDGTNTSGTIVPDGIYYFQFNADNEAIDSNTCSLIPGDHSSISVNTKNTVVDSNGNQFTINGDTISKLDSSNNPLLDITATDIGVNNFSPLALEIDDNDNLYILDGTQNTLFKIDKYININNKIPYSSDIAWEDERITLTNPTGMALDANNNIYIANNGGNDIIKLAAGRGKIEYSTITAKINVPYEKSLVSYYVPVFGTATARNFDYYVVELGAGTNPTQWEELMRSNSEVIYDNQPIEKFITIYGNLATWKTTTYTGWAISGDIYKYPMGPYTIRLTVYNKDGNYKQDSVLVEMAQVIGQWDSAMTSDDGLVVFDYPHYSIPDDYDLFSITPVEPSDAPAIDDPELTQVGKIYQIKPVGYKFKKTCTLKMYYTDTQVGDIPEDTLKIYRWNPIIKKWIFVYADLDTGGNVLTTNLSEFNDYEVYYAVLSDPPPAPVIYQPASPTNFRYLTVFGNASPGVSVEIFVNDISKGSVVADVNSGDFVKTSVELKSGQNQLTALAVDPVGNTSPLSNPVNVEFNILQPTSVTSVMFMTADFSKELTGDVSLDEKLYIELVGTDGGSSSIDSATILVKSSSDTSGISINLLETSENSGIYRGIVSLGETSDPSTGIIKISNIVSETITIYPQIDLQQTDAIKIIDTIPPPAPEISSNTHPSLCQNTFEYNMDEWKNMSNGFGASLTRTSQESASGNYALSLVNSQEGGDFASYVRTTSFNARDYPIISFDYKIPENLKLNMVAYVNGMLKEIVFTDDPKTVESFEEDLYRPIGTIENVVADNTWHHAEFNLYNLLKADDPNQNEYIVQELFFADYNLPGWLELVMGEENPQGTTYFIDNFIISSEGKANKNPVFEWTPNDSSVIGYSYSLDQSSQTIPDQITESTLNTVTFTDIADGIWYFHVRSVDTGDNWGPANHYQIMIDTTGPIASSPVPEDNSSSGSLQVQITLSDGSGSGVDPDTIKIMVKDVEYDMSSGGLVYNDLTEVLTFSLWKVTPVPDPWVDAETITARVIAAKDFSGNNIQSEYNWSWTVDYSQLTGGTISLLTTQGGFTPSWSPDETQIAFMSERSGNQDIWIINSMDYAEQSGNLTQITQDTSNDHHPAWSPDSNKIAFVSDRSGIDHIYTINPDGTGLTQITTGDKKDSHPTWSPDSSKLAFSREDEIWAINADGSNLTQITIGSVEYYLDPVWSPDGSKIAFTKSLYVNEVAIMNSDGNNQEVITTSGADKLPTWSAKTNNIVFVSQRNDTGFGIRIIENNGSNDEVYIDNEQTYMDTEPELSPVNDIIAFESTRNGTWNIWVKTQIFLTDVRISNEVISPNFDTIKESTSITFTLAGGSANLDIFIFDENNTIIKSVANNELYTPGEITFSWDGTDDVSNVVPDGKYTFKISIKGSAGNSSSTQSSGVITVDTTPPSFSNWQIFDEVLAEGAQDISVNVADGTQVDDNNTVLQYGVASTYDKTAPDILPWTDFANNNNGVVNLKWEDYDSNYFLVRGFAEDTNGNIGYSDVQIRALSVGNVPPSISGLAESYTIAEDQIAGPIEFSATDPESDDASLAISIVSYSSTLIEIISIENGLTASGRILTITPVSNQYGNSDIQLAITDGTLTTTTSFALVISPVNDAPQIAGITSQYTTLEDISIEAINITLTDFESDETLLVSILSSNTELVPLENIVLSGTGSNRILSITPTSNQSGTMSITLAVSDSELTSTKSFQLSVMAVNDPPELLSIDDQTIIGNTVLNAIKITPTDLDAAVCELTLSMQSSDESKIANNAMFYKCDDNTYTMILSSPINAADNVTIIVTASDAFNLSASQSFNLNIISANSALVFSDNAEESFMDIGANSDQLDGVQVMEMMQRLYPENEKQLESSQFGLALVEANNIDGQYQYSLNNGQSWNDISGISEENAILLSASNSDTRIRFLHGNYKFKTTPSYLKYVIWDQNYGTNGQTGVNIYDTNNSATVRNAEGLIKFIVYEKVEDLYVANIPTLSEWGRMLFFMLLFFIGFYLVRRKKNGACIN